MAPMLYIGLAVLICGLSALFAAAQTDPTVRDEARRQRALRRLNLQGE